MAASRVQTRSSAKTTWSTSSTVTFPTPTTAGNLLVATMVIVNGSSTTVLNGIVDSASNNWQRASSFNTGFAFVPPAAYSAGLGSAIAYVEDSPSVSSITFTYPSCQRFYVQVTEVHGGGAPLSFVGDVTFGIGNVSTAPGGISFFSCCTENATTFSGGWTTLLNTIGNLAGYKLTTGSNLSVNWSPTQAGALSMAVFNQGPIKINGTATLTETESITAYVAQAPIASLVEEEALSATGNVAGAQAEFSLLPTDQTDPSGIPGRKGLTTYHWPDALATQYDRYASLQEGQLVSGSYNAAPDVELYRDAAGMWRTPDSLTVDGKLLLTDTTDASESAGNAPALRIGNVAGTHLRIDGNEIVAMASDTAAGTLFVNVLTAGKLRGDNIAGGSVFITPVANTPTSTTITGLGLPSGLSYVPQVTGNSASAAFQWVTASAPSENGLTITLLRSNTTSTAVYWTLIGV